MRKKNTNLHPLLNAEAAHPTVIDFSGHAAMELRLWTKIVKASSRAETELQERLWILQGIARWKPTGSSQDVKCLTYVPSH